MNDEIKKNSKEDSVEKKTYETPEFIHHDPLKSVSTTVYYYVYG